MSCLYIGTSGWSYPHWRDCFYCDIPRKDWLRFYAERFSALEINASFYRLQSPETFQKWVEQTPAGFRFALKANRYLTHNKKLLDPEASISIEKQHAEALGDRLAVVLWQLPSSLKKDLPRLKAFIDRLRVWNEVRHSIEFRHSSWFDDETATCLSSANIAICQSDAQTWPIWQCVSADFVYLRLHGHTVSYASSYGDSELGSWASCITGWLTQGRDVHVYFDNDAECAAPRNASVLKCLLELAP
ncbi:MAG: DUF72 domain-containing protein [Gammaproteobacteria bacterium]